MSTTARETEQRCPSRSLFVLDGEIDYTLKGRKFRSVTNFTLDVLFSVRSPPDSPQLCGFVYAIKTTDGDGRSRFQGL